MKCRCRCIKIALRMSWRLVGLTACLHVIAGFKSLSGGDGEYNLITIPSLEVMIEERSIGSMDFIVN